jgi:hypothetical protein
MQPSKVGWVYLIRQGKFHKLGATDNPARRWRELAKQTPENMSLEHEIGTDDHFGLEAYWKNRWNKKGHNHRGEFYELPKSEIQSFKRMKHF